MTIFYRFYDKFRILESKAKFKIVIAWVPGESVAPPVAFSLLANLFGDKSKKRVVLNGFSLLGLDDFKDASCL